MSLFSILGVVLGFAAHHIFLEWHVQAPTLVASHVVTFCCLQISAILPGITSPAGLPNIGILVFYGYLAGLTFSIVIYRLLFHRLTKAGISGPWYAPISTIWSVWASRNRMYYLTLHALHNKYGDFVRTGKTNQYPVFNILPSSTLIIYILDRSCRGGSLPSRRLHSH